MEPLSADVLADRLRQAGRWCQEYLELQHSRDLGTAFGAVMEAFARIAAPEAADGGDRFERLKELERELDERLTALAAAHRESVAARIQPANAEQPHAADETSLLFVYGTLKRGGSREFALAGQRCFGDARTAATYRLYHCGDFPALVRDANGMAIEGELWEVDAACLQRLDDIEGVSLRLYERAPIALQPPHDAATVESYFYLRSVSGLRDCGSRWP